MSESDAWYTGACGMPLVDVPSIAEDDIGDLVCSRWVCCGALLRGTDEEEGVGIECCRRVRTVWSVEGVANGFYVRARTVVRDLHRKAR